MFDPQVTIAAKLAAAHSHGWAISREDWRVPITETESLTRGRLPQTLEEARMASRWAAAPPMPGLVYAVDEDGWHCHRTGSGRVQWAVAPDGSWVVNVCRPGNVVVLRVEGAASGRISGHEVLGDYYLRHIEALAQALRAVATNQTDSLVTRLLLGITDAEATAEHERLTRYTDERREYEPSYRGPWIAPLLAARARRAAVRVLPGESVASYCARRAAS